jgi:IS5 family transposase
LPGARNGRRAIEFTRGRPQRVQLDREPLRITRATPAHLDAAAAGLAGNPAAGSWRARVCRYRPLVEHAQTERRVPAGEAVPAIGKPACSSRMPTSS